MMPADDDEMVTVFCQSGCGRSAQLRKAWIYDGDVFVCHDHYFVLPLFPGKVRTFSQYTCNGISGMPFYKVRDMFPDPETALELMEAQESMAQVIAEREAEEAIARASGKVWDPYRED